MKNRPQDNCQNQGIDGYRSMPFTATMILCLLLPLFACVPPGEHDVFLTADVVTPCPPLSACAAGQLGWQIPFKGLQIEQEGVASWNNTSYSIGPVGTGHAIRTTLTGVCQTNPVALYFQTSRDGGIYQIDPNSSAGVHGLLGMQGFPRLAKALSENGLTTENLTVKWGLQSLGNDREHQDWWVDGTIETRYYTGGDFTIQLEGKDLVGGPMPRTVFSIDYNLPGDCTDDQFYGTTDPTSLTNKSANQTVAARVATAFLDDLGNKGIRFVFSTYQDAGWPTNLTQSGRTGAFYDIESGHIETAWLSVPMAWGENNQRQLGDGTPAASIGLPPQLTPQPVVNLTDVRAIAGGGHASLALKNDGTVWWWGDNAFNTGVSMPEQVGGVSDAVAIAAGWWHKLALDESGSVWSWGPNNQGQLGDGCDIEYPVRVSFPLPPVADSPRRCTSSETPTPINSLSDIKAISAGDFHNLALGKSDGSVWAWGLNWNGQLGTNTNISSSTPQQTVSDQGWQAGGPLTGVSAIAAGGGGFEESHSLALKNGKVLAWGGNSLGQLGNGTTTPSTHPVEVVDPGNTTQPLTNVIGIAAGGGFEESHSLALKSDGTVWAWGDNSMGQLGDGTTNNSSIPVQVIGLPSVAAIAAGGLHSLALATDGTVWAWGRNFISRSSNLTPVGDDHLRGVVAVAAGSSHNLAITVAYGVVGPAGGTVMDLGGMGASISVGPGILADDTEVAVELRRLATADITLNPNPGPVLATIILPLTANLTPGSNRDLFKLNPLTDFLIDTGIDGTVSPDGQTVTYSGVLNWQGRFRR